jgi:uncharacterized protein (TIGR01777 family)
MATVLLTGGTGMIGRRLIGALRDRGYDVIILSRKQPSVRDQTPDLSYAQWNIEEGRIDLAAIAKADFIIHLAGAGIAESRWTEKRKQEIVDSRVKSSQLLAKTLQNNPNNVKAVISASAIGWYGADPVVPGKGPFTEDDPPSDNFLGQTCKRWEASIGEVAEQGIRLVVLRTGIVLEHRGGVLAEFEKPLKFGIATILGSGSQVMSWIHIDDLVRLYIKATADEQMRGPYNAVAPVPVSNKDLVMTLASKKRGRWFVPVYVPSFVLRLAFGELSTEVLKSVTVSCRKILDSGFDFHYPEIEKALTALDQ